MAAAAAAAAACDTLPQIAAAVLHLGNVKFVPAGEDGSAIGAGASTDECAAAAALLGVDAATLAVELCQKRIPRAPAPTPVSVTKADDNKHALARAVYGRAFDWLVKRVNTSLDSKSGRYVIICAPRPPLSRLSRCRAKYIVGVLDIFGFEIFERNSFEQLCINYCNEKLQQHFNQFVFKEETRVYTEEGIDFTEVRPCDSCAPASGTLLLRRLSLKTIKMFWTSSTSRLRGSSACSMMTSRCQRSVVRKGARVCNTQWHVLCASIGLGRELPEACKQGTCAQPAIPCPRTRRQNDVGCTVWCRSLRRGGDV